jgi:hypothetical protein
MRYSLRYCIWQGRIIHKIRFPNVAKRNISFGAHDLAHIVNICQEQSALSDPEFESSIIDD